MRGLLRIGLLVTCFVSHVFAEDKPGVAQPATDKRAEKRFLDRGEYIEDLTTGLLWQKDGVASGKLNFYQAAEYTKNLKLDKLTGWRVPTADEYATIFPAEDAPFTNSGYNPEQCCGGGKEFRSYWTSEMQGPVEKDYAFVYHWYDKGGKNNCFASKNFVYVRGVREKKGATELADVVDPKKPKDPLSAFAPEVRSKVRSLVADLAHNDFKRREEAHRSLQTMGAEIHPLHRAELAQAGDPEAKYRLQRLLGQ